MSDSRTKNSLRNSITGFINKVFNLLIPFFIRTIIIKVIGVDYLGLSSLYSSILQVLSLSELGFSISIAFSLYKPIAENDTETICALLNFLKKIYRVVGLIILAVGAALMPALPYLIEGTYPADINLYILYSIYLINTSVSYFLFSYKSVLLAACQRTDIENNILTATNLVLYALQIAALMLFKNYYLYVILIPILTVCTNIIREIVTRKKFPDYFCKGNIDKETRKEIFKNIKALVGHRLSNVVVSSTDNIFISAFLGLASVAVYNNYYYVVNAVTGFILIFFSSLTASIGNKIVTADRDTNYRDFNRLTFINVWMVGWMSICLLCLYQHFMLLWVGEELMLPFITVILFTVYFYSWRFKDMLATYKDAAGMWNIDFWKPYVVSILNIILDFVLVNFLGINGVILATILSVPLVSLPWETQTFFKAYFKRSPLKYYLKMLIYTLVIVATAFVTCIICNLLPFVGYGWFALKFLICLVLPNLIFVCASFWTQEFKWVLQKVLCIFKRKKDKAE